VITSYAHDLPLEWAVEFGVPGAVLALAIYLLVARAAWRSRGVADGWLLALPALAFMAANLVDWPWHIAGMGAVWAATAAALMTASLDTLRPQLPKRALPPSGPDPSGPADGNAWLWSSQTERP
jgi:O-antigen ligase